MILQSSEVTLLFLKLTPNAFFQAGPQSSVVKHIIPLSPYACLDKMLGIMLLFTLSVLLVGTPLLKVQLSLSIYPSC